VDLPIGYDIKYKKEIYIMDDTKNDDFKELIKNLRVRLEKSVEELKNLEKKGDEDSAQSAIWSVYYIWNGKEYEELEKKLKEKGYKSGL